jgi:hypothetical protein
MAGIVAMPEPVVRRPRGLALAQESLDTPCSLQARQSCSSPLDSPTGAIVRQAPEIPRVLRGLTALVAALLILVPAATAAAGLTRRGRASYVT